MTNNYQNINIGTYNPISNNGGNYNYSSTQIPESVNNIQETVPDIIQQHNSSEEYNAPAHARLNALDSTLLENEAYQNLDDDVFKTEYKISRIENEIKLIEKEIENAKKINDFQKVDVLTMRKHSLQNALIPLYESYGNSDVTTKLSGELTSILNVKPTIITKVFDSCKNFVSDKILPKVSKTFNSGKNIKTALNKLETLNKNVDELVTMQTPYGEADERYDRLTDYLNRANVIHYQISKTVGAPSFFDTISSIDKEKIKKPQNRVGFGKMTGKPNI